MSAIIDWNSWSHGQILLMVAFLGAGLGSFVADVDFGRLRSEKADEISGELGRIMKMAAGYGISATELGKILKGLQEEDNG